MLIELFAEGVTWDLVIAATLSAESHREGGRTCAHGLARFVYIARELARFAKAAPAQVDSLTLCGTCIGE